MTSAAPDAPFGRVLTAMATAFDRDGALDIDGTVRIAEHLVEHGHDGVVVSGTTGESPTTEASEKFELLRAIIDSVGGRAKVVAGVGSNATAHSIQLAQDAERAGADGLLLVTPYYNKPSQPGILQHIRQVARAADVPVMLYDVPGRTAATITPDTYARAAELDSVVAVKDAVGDYARGVAVMERTGLAFYSGDDVSTLGWLAHGACGVVSVAGHAVGEELRAMVDAYGSGDHHAALASYRRQLPVIDAIMGVPNYGATTAKAALQLLGVLDNRTVRSPLVELDEDEYAALSAVLTGAGIL